MQKSVICAIVKCSHLNTHYLDKQRNEVSQWSNSSSSWIPNLFGHQTQWVNSESLKYTFDNWFCTND